MTLDFSNAVIANLPAAKRKLEIITPGTTFTDEWTWTNMQVNATGVGFNGNPATGKSLPYTISNAVPTRVLDVSTATLADGLNCLAALVADLKSVGLLG
jgi:hypothetical protein